MFDEVASGLGSMESSGSGGGSAGYGSGLIGGILDAFIGPVMANEQFQRAKHISRRGMKAAQFLAENQPSWQMEGFRRAGVNPLLALTRGVSGPSFAPQIASPDIDTGSFSEAISRGISSGRQLTLLNTQKRILDETLREQTNKANASINLDRRMRAEVGEILKRIDSLDQGMRTSAAQADMYESSASEMRANARLLGTRERAERMAIPYDPSQVQAVGKTPVGEVGRMIKRFLRATPGAVRSWWEQSKEDYRRQYE